MRIIEMAGIESKVVAHGMTKVADHQINKSVGETFNYVGHVLFADTDERGDEREFVAILDDKGESWTTGSRVALEDFKDAVADLEGEKFAFRILEGKSKTDQAFYQLKTVEWV